MAYAAAILYNDAATAKPLKDGRYVEVMISETEGAAASEATLTLPPGFYDLVRLDLVKSAGDATAFSPTVGGATGVSGIDLLAQPASATASPIRTTGHAYLRTTRAGNLYYQSVPNAGSNNTVAVRLVFVRLGPL